MNIHNLVSLIRSYAPYYIEPALIVIAVISLLAVLCLRIFKKRHHSVPTMEYYPPDGVSPAEAGYIIDGHVSASDMTSLIYYWASHGHLSIEMTGEKSFTLHKLSALDDAHPDYEKQFFSDLWDLDGLSVKKKYASELGRKNVYLPGLNNTVTSSRLVQDFDPVVANACRNLRASFDGTSRKLTVPYRSTIATLVPSILSVAAMLLPITQYLKAWGLTAILTTLGLNAVISFFLWLRCTPRWVLNDDSASLLARTAGFLLPFMGLTISELFTIPLPKDTNLNLWPTLVALLFYLASGLFERGYMYRHTDKTSSLLYSVAGWMVAAGTAAMYTVLFADTLIDVWAVALFSVCVIICLAFSPGIRSHTAYGSELLTRCKSFRHFLVTAEKSRIEMLIADDPNYYYNILPYVHVLGVSDIWMQKTEFIPIDLPDWFSKEYGAPNEIVSDMMGMLDSISDLLSNRTHQSSSIDRD